MSMDPIQAIPAVEPKVPYGGGEVETAAYDEVFPALPDGGHPGGGPAPATWGPRMKVKPTSITQVFNVPLEGRRQRFGEGEQSKICAAIMQETGSTIEIAASKDQCLTILVSGKEETVMRAKQKLTQALQAPVTIEIAVPKEHHKFILGKKGQNLSELEQRTNTRISVPRMDDPSDIIQITGPRDGIEEARARIMQISDEKGKQAMERINVPKAHHPFILGPNGSTLAQIMEETGTRINMPPPSVNKDDISVAGDKEGVASAVAKILHISKEAEKHQVVQMEVKKSQHKYINGVRGQGIHDILQETGVYVEMPRQNDPSETIVLRGEPRKMGLALSLVNDRANSAVQEEVDAPAWLHKYIIGKSGANIREKTGDLDKVQIEFKENKIVLDGPREQVEQAKLRLEAMLQDLRSRLALDSIPVEPRFHRHIVGKSGGNVQKLKRDYDVQIYVPSDSPNGSTPAEANLIRIEGHPTNVAQAKAQLLELVHKLEKEVTRELVIEQRFHRTIIGTKGERIREIRSMFNEVNVTFPEQGVKSDKVTLRGPKEDVEACSAHLAQINKELCASIAQVEVPIFKQFHKFIIGKGGSNIRKIREETDTKIELPGEGSDSDVIVISGKPENVHAARDRILAIQNEQANIIQVDLMIPCKYHTSLIGTKGRLVRSIMDDCGVSIHFPQENSGSDRVTIRGPKEDVAKAKKVLLELSNEKQETGFTAEVRAKADHIRFLIGRNGINVRKLRDETNTRIVFPSEKDEDREAIVLIGRKEDVQKAKKKLEETIKELEKIEERTIQVDPKHHSYFITRKCEVLNQIIQDFGGVKISFPKPQECSSTVRLKGARDCVNGAIQRIEELVLELESRIVMECHIPPDHHGAVMGARGHKLKNICTDYNVFVKFPEKMSNGVVNGGFVPNAGGDDQRRDVIHITGKQEDCERARDALLALVPVTEEMTVPFDLHRFIIGKNGKDVRELNDSHNVNIAIPPAEQHSEVVTIRGLAENVASARAALQARIEQLEAEQQDKVLRSYQLEVDVDPIYHRKIIGKNGVVINRIRKQHDVVIQMPKGEGASTIVITGYEDKALAAQKDILKIVQDLESMITKELSLDPRMHKRVIGARGSNIRKIMDKYKVDINFPKEGSGLVTVTGQEADVDEACEHLISLEDEFLADLQETEEQRQYIFRREAPRAEPPPPPRQDKKKEFLVVGGPWDSQEFPSIEGSAPAATPVASWGPRR